MTKSEEERLSKQILYHKKRYYDGEPEISDAEYDLLEEKLRSLNPDHPVLYIVGTPEGGKIIHDPPMLSSDKATSLDEVVKWANKIGDNTLFAGFKVDGLSLSIVYENGKLIQAATRGNGISGDDVTYAVMSVKEIPKSIPFKGRINIRGELYMTISEFEKVNSSLDKDQKFSSPRNLAAGTIKQKDVTQIHNRSLSFKAFDLIGLEDTKSIKELVEILTFWGFDTADNVFIEQNNSNELESVFLQVEENRSKLDFEIDGVIFKYNEAADRKLAGSTEHHPKWQIAWKFKNVGSITTISDIIWQVGRTGNLTPVAIVEPVELKGATISRATMHNADFIENLNIAIGDEVVIERAGDVIPKIISVNEKGENNYLFPQKCPSCKNSLLREGVNLICISEPCREKDIQSIIHWIRVVDIENLGPKTVEKLYDLGVVQHYSNLYSDTITTDLLVRNFGKNGKKMMMSINESREVSFSDFLAGLGIPMLGKKQGKELSKHYSSLEQLQQTTIEELLNIEGISSITANYILSGINDPLRAQKLLENNVQIIYGKKEKKIKQASNQSPTTSLADFWDDVETPTSQKSSLGDFWENTSSNSIGKTLEIDSNSNIGNGMKIYITGSVKGFSKKKLQQFIEDIGFIWSTSITKNLDILVYGNNAGETKLDKAKEIGINVYSWMEFLEKYEINI
ncbi:MAG: NAD-dependent DNA ligase LigA [Candidatus Kariarchaeaceae archaeon]